VDTKTLLLLQTVNIVFERCSDRQPQNAASDEP